MDELLARQNNVTTDEIRDFLLRTGFTLDRQRGSHMGVSTSGRVESLVIPPRRPTVKSIYVRLAVAAMKEVLDE